MDIALQWAVNGICTRSRELERALDLTRNTTVDGAGYIVAECLGTCRQSHTSNVGLMLNSLRVNHDGYHVIYRLFAALLCKEHGRQNGDAGDLERRTGHI